MLSHDYLSLAAEIALENTSSPFLTVETEREATDVL